MTHEILKVFLEVQEHRCELLDRLADEEQKVANRLYEARAKEEEYMKATIGAQLFRLLASQEHTILNSMRERFEDAGWPPEPFETIHTGIVSAKNRDPEGTNDFSRIVDPDLFRTYLEFVVREITMLKHKGVDIHRDFTKMAKECEKILEDNPISPARIVQSQYEGYLKECLEVFDEIMDPAADLDTDTMKRIHAIQIGIRHRLERGID